MKVRRLIAATGLTVALGFTGAPLTQADSIPGGAEGCGASAQPVPVVAKGQQIAYPKTCSFVAKRDGGYAGNGTFKITIVRPAKPKPLTIVLTDKNAATYCTSAIKAKDKVTVEVTSGSMAAGNPFPTGTPSTNSAGADHKACLKK